MLLTDIQDVDLVELDSLLGRTAPTALFLDYGRVAEATDPLTLAGKDQNALTLATGFISSPTSSHRSTRSMLVEELIALSSTGIRNVEVNRVTETSSSLVLHGRAGSIEVSLSAVLGGADHRFELHLLGADVHWKVEHGFPGSAAPSRWTREDAQGARSWTSALHTTARRQLEYFFHLIVTGAGSSSELDDFARAVTQARSVSTQPQLRPRSLRHEPSDMDFGVARR